MPNDQIFRADRKYALKACARLRAFRTEAGLAAPDVAEHLEIPTALYAHYELVPHQLIPPLCQFLNFSPWHYLTGMSDEYSHRNEAKQVSYAMLVPTVKMIKGEIAKNW